MAFFDTHVHTSPTPQVCKVYVGSFNSDAPIREVRSAGRRCHCIHSHSHIVLYIHTFWAGGAVFRAHASYIHLFVPYTNTFSVHNRAHYHREFTRFPKPPLPPPLRTRTLTARPCLRRSTRSCSTPCTSAHRGGECVCAGGGGHRCTARPCLRRSTRSCSNPCTSARRGGEWACLGLDCTVAFR